MSYFDTYKQRMLSNGSSQIDSVKNATTQIVKNTFKDSPSYKQVLINGVTVDVQLIHSDQSNEKSILFLPNISFDIGSVVDINSKKWLMVDFFDNDITPKGQLKYCNSTFKLSGTTTKTQIGEDYLGRPIYEEETTGDEFIPCIADSRIFNQPTSEDVVNLPDNKLEITMQYTTHKDVDYGQKFEMYNQKFLIVGMDYTNVADGKGTIKIIGEREG